ncbi:MAG: hypothetical protein V4612_02635 [Pseudomonadota bacterium]
MHEREITGFDAQSLAFVLNDPQVTTLKFKPKNFPSDQMDAEMQHCFRIIGKKHDAYQSQYR